MANPRYAPLALRQEQKRAVDQIDQLLEPGEDDLVRATKPINRGLLKKRRAKEQARLDEITPPPADTDDKKKYLDTRIQRLEEAIRNGSPQHGIPPMPSRQVMDDPVAGSVGQHRTWEHFWFNHTLDSNGRLVRIDPHKQRGGLDELKDWRRARYQEAEDFDPDIANLERMRPDKRRDGTRSVFSPFIGTSAEDYARVFGPDAGSEVSRKIAEAEKEGRVHVPTHEEIYAKPEPKIAPATQAICGYMTENGPCGMKVKVGERCRHHEGKEE